MTPGRPRPARVQGGTRADRRPRRPRPGDHRPAPVGPDRQRRTADRRRRLPALRADAAPEHRQRPGVGTFRDALAPLARPDLTVVGHNLPFDLAFLRREGVPVAGEGRDTLKILRLLDQDRGAGSQGQARVDLRAPAGAEVLLNYRLKDVVRQLLRQRMPYFPGTIETGPVRGAPHLPGLRPARDPGPLRPPLAPAGACWPAVLPADRCTADPGPAGDDRGGGRRRCRLHPRRVRPAGAADGAAVGGAPSEHGVALGLDQEQLGRWLFGTLGLPVLKHGRRGTRWVPSLDAEALRRLVAFNDDPQGRRLAPADPRLPPGGRPDGPAPGAW